MLQPVIVEPLERKVEDAEITMNEGDATTNNIFQSAPQTSNLLPVSNRTENKSKQNDCRHLKFKMSLKSFGETLPVFNHSKITDNLESSKVKNLILNEYSEDCNKYSESSSLLEHTKHRLGPTTRPLPRQAAASCKSNNYKPLDQTRVGGTPRFSPRQILDRAKLPRFHPTQDLDGS